MSVCLSLLLLLSLFFLRLRSPTCWPPAVLTPPCSCLTCPLSASCRLSQVGRAQHSTAARQAVCVRGMPVWWQFVYLEAKDARLNASNRQIMDRVISGEDHDPIGIVIELVLSD